MAEPWIFNVIDPQEQIFTFSNGQVTFTVDTQFDPTQLPESVTVQSVMLENHHDTVALGITNVEVPPPVIEHVSGHFDPGHFDLLSTCCSEDGPRCVKPSADLAFIPAKAL